MRLIRLATVSLSRPAPSSVGRWQYTSSNGIDVTSTPLKVLEDSNEDPDIQEGGVRLTWPDPNHEVALLLTAETDAGRVLRRDDERLEIYQPARERAEAALLEFADLLAVFCQCRRILRSPQTCIALKPENDDERLLLENNNRLVGLQNPPGRAVLCPPLDPPTHRSLTEDRTDGVALLADSLAEESAAGRVRDLFRFFERAFRSNPSAIIEPLLKFLQSGRQDLGYDSDEISMWLNPGPSLRSLVTHADRRDDYARGPDIEPHIGRIEYAAYDVLFNKARWRNLEPIRRAGLRLNAGIGQDGQVQIYRHGTVVVVPWMDPFGVFPVIFPLNRQPLKIEMPRPWILLSHYPPGYIGSSLVQTRVRYDPEDPD